MKDKITSNTNSFDIKFQRLNTDAPNTFLIPISLVRCSAINDASPNKPRHEIKTANTENIVARLLVCSSSANFFAYSSSVNLNTNGLAGLYFLKTVSILFNAVRIGIEGFMRTVIKFEKLLSNANMVGSTGLYGELITIFFIIPIMVNSRPPHLIVLPTGCLKPINFKAASLIIIPLLSVAKLLVKSLPDESCQPSVFP